MLFLPLRLKKNQYKHNLKKIKGKLKENIIFIHKFIFIFIYIYAPNRPKFSFAILFRAILPPPYTSSPATTFLCYSLLAHTLPVWYLCFVYGHTCPTRRRPHCQVTNSFITRHFFLNPKPPNPLLFIHTYILHSFHGFNGVQIEWTTERSSTRLLSSVC
jgi:hypothetical protein